MRNLFAGLFSVRGAFSLEAEGVDLSLVRAHTAAMKPLSWTDPANDNGTADGYVTAVTLALHAFLEGLSVPAYLLTGATSVQPPPEGASHRWPKLVLPTTRGRISFRDG